MIKCLDCGSNFAYEGPAKVGAECSTLMCDGRLSDDDFAEGYEVKPISDTRVFATGATRDADESKLDYEGFLSPQVLKCYAEYMHRAQLRNVPPGQTIRSSDNWQKGIPKDVYMKSLVRHVMEAWEQTRTGDTTVDRDAFSAILFNAMGWLYEDINGR